MLFVSTTAITRRRVLIAAGVAMNRGYGTWGSRMSIRTVPSGPFCVQNSSYHAHFEYKHCTF